MVIPESEIKDKINPAEDKKATNINSFGKIDLKKGPAFSGFNILNTDGAIMAVWNRITPQIKPEIKICIFTIIFEKLTYKNYYHDNSLSNISKYIFSSLDLSNFNNFFLSFLS